MDIWHYPDDTRILPTNNNVDVYQFSNSQLKYLPKDSVTTLLKSFLYLNMSLGILVDLGLVSFAMKTDTKFLFTP